MSAQLPRRTRKAGKEDMSGKRRKLSTIQAKAPATPVETPGTPIIKSSVGKDAVHDLFVNLLYSRIFLMGLPARLG